MQNRSCRASRETRETEISVRIGLDGGRIAVSTGMPFLDHMLESMAVHGHLGMEAAASGDLEVDSHHLLEDAGLVLGLALREGAGDLRGILRAGHSIFPMDGSLAVLSLDICGRPGLFWAVELDDTPIGGIYPKLFREFFAGLSRGMGAAIHVRSLAVDNSHHILEACFKALGRAVEMAFEKAAVDRCPSTKGSIDD